MRLGDQHVQAVGVANHYPYYNRQARGPQDGRFLSLPELKSGARIVAVSREGEQSAPAASMLATLRTLQVHPVGSAPRRRA